MKILHVNHLLDPVSGGGTAERTFQLTRFLTSLGMRCGILTLDIGDTLPYESKLTMEQIYKLPCINQRYYIHFSWPLHIRKIVAQYDVVHLMGHWTLLNAIVAMICRSLKKPYVVCPAGSLKVTGSSHLLKKLYNLLVGRTLIRKASAWIAVTEDEKQDFLAFGISPDKVRVIPNGIDPTQYIKTADGSPRILRADIQGKVGEAPYILFLGRLNHIKGPDLLLQAFISISEHYPSVHLVFAGPDSGMLESLLSATESSGIADKVHFVGYVGGDDKVSLLRCATALVIPSRNEAMSVVVLEAGICGTPVIFTDRCGLNDIAGADAGYMVRADAGDTARGLRLMLDDAESRQRIKDNLSAIVERDYLWISQARKYEHTYQGLVNGL